MPLTICPAQELVKFAKEQDVEALKEILKSYSVNIKSEDGLPAVAILASIGNVKAVDFLIKNFNACRHDALIGFAMAGLTENMQLQIKLGANPEYAYMGYALRSKGDNYRPNINSLTRNQILLSCQGLGLSGSTQFSTFMQSLTNHGGTQKLKKEAWEKYVYGLGISGQSNLIHRDNDFENACAVFIEYYKVTGLNKKNRKTDKELAELFKCETDIILMKASISNQKLDKKDLFFDHYKMLCSEKYLQGVFDRGIGEGGLIALAEREFLARPGSTAQQALALQLMLGFANIKDFKQMSIYLNKCNCPEWAISQINLSPIPHQDALHSLSLIDNKICRERFAACIQIPPGIFDVKKILLNAAAINQCMRKNAIDYHAAKAKVDEDTFTKQHRSAKRSFWAMMSASTLFALKAPEGSQDDADLHNSLIANEYSPTENKYN